MHATLLRSLALAPLVSFVLCCPASAQHGLPPAPLPPVPEQASDFDGVSPATHPGATQPPSEADLERARVLFAEGLAFVAQQDWQRAAERFTQVRAIRSSPVVSYNLASALAELGQLVESSKLLTLLLSDAQADPETHDAAQLLLSKIEPNIGALSINVYGNVEGCAFALDGQPIEITGGALSLRVDVGPHRVTVERDAATILSPEVTIGGTFPMHAQLSLEIPAKPRPVVIALPRPQPAPVLRLQEASRPPPRDDASVLGQWWLWAGAGALVAAGVITAVALTSSDEPMPIGGDVNPPVIHTRVVLGAMR